MVNIKLTNFGLLKNTYNSILTESILNKDKKKENLFKQYVNAINENKILRTQFLVYTNIENKVETDINKATEFVKENINLFSNFKKNDIREANKKLAEFLKEDYKVNGENESLYENINTLIFTEKNPNSIDLIIETTSKVVDYILNNKVVERIDPIMLPNSMITTMMVDKYNEKYSTLNESDKNLIKSLIDSDEAKQEEVYKSIIRECIDLVNSRLTTEDLEVKDKLLKVKDKLLNEEFNKKSEFIKNISKLVELRDSLSSN